MEGPDGGDDQADPSPNGPEPNAGATDPAARPPGSDDAAERTEADGDAGSAVEPDPGPDSTESERPEGRSPAPSNDVTIEDDGVLRWFLKTNDGTVVFARDALTSVAVVAVVALVLFAVSGIWPPLVAVESGSMEPNMQKGDLIFVADQDRFVGDDPVEGTGVVTYEVGSENDHERFDEPGDVIIFRPDGQTDATPVIHRAHFWVEGGENWVETKANSEWTNGRTCAEIAACPAEHDGFVTKGDANEGYDQAGLGGSNTNEVVKPEWIEGKAVFRIPYLGYVRLTFDSLLWAGGGTAVHPGAATSSQVVSTAAPAGGIGAVAGGVAGGAAFAGGAAVAVGRRT